MFLNTAELKKLIKRAYNKGKLYIGVLSGDYIINGCNFTLMVDKNRIPRKILATIIELTGELPSAGEGKSYGRGLEFAPEVDNEERWEEYFDVDRALVKYIITNVLLERGGSLARVIQAPDNTKNMIAESCMAAVDWNPNVKGPFGKNNAGNSIIWYDDDCIFLARTVKTDKEEELLEDIKNVWLPDRYLNMGGGHE